MSKLYLIYGEDELSSRNYFHQILKSLETENKKELVKVLGKNLTPELLLSHVQSHSFFGEARVVSIESLNNGNKNKFKNDLVKILIDVKNISSEVDLIIWEKGELGASILKLFKSYEIKEFKLPFIIFSLLDGLIPNNYSFLHGKLEEVLKLQPVELVFYMITKRVRQLLEISSGITPKSAPWQVKKLQTQTAKFDIRILKKFYMDLILLDYNNKSGNIVTNLADELDMLLIKL